MAKGSRRQKIKDVLLSSPLSSRSPPQVVESLTEDDLLDDLMAELDAKDTNVQAAAATILQEIATNNQQDGELNGSSPSGQKKDSKSRHRARQERKAAALAAHYAPDDMHIEERIAQETQEERRIFGDACAHLGLEIYEVNPDGHCLFSAIADQLAVFSILPPALANYVTTRAVAADYIQSHPDDFLPFLPCASGEDGDGAMDGGLMTAQEFATYCDNIRNRAQWGGEPEIQALSRAYAIPIHVVQGAKPNIVMHAPEGPLRSEKPAMISYHRRMYGLGEHYNSLRPKSQISRRLTQGIAAVL